jgi:hypothetical protein
VDRGDVCASGPDAIHAKLLKVAYDIISKPLCAIFNISLITKYFPNKWKLAKVTPVHKKEDKNNNKGLRWTIVEHLH